MVNIILLEQNGNIKMIDIDSNMKKEELKATQYTKHQVKFIHKWKLKNILENVNSELSLNIYAKNKFKNGLEINKHDLPPPLHNLDNVYYGNILIIGLDNDDNIINFDKDHWKSLVKIINEEDDEDEEEEEEDEEEDEEDEEFIANSSEESEIYDDLEEDDDMDESDNIKEYEQIIGKQTVTIFRLKQRIKIIEEKLKSNVK
jgi:hypothetical protein